MQLDPGTFVQVAGPLGDVTTERLELRRIGSTDTDALAAVFELPEVWRYPYGRGLTAAETARFVTGQVAHWETTSFGLWRVAERASARTVGFVGLSTPTFLPAILPAVEVGWRLDPHVWGRGYAAEGAAAALREGFTTLGLTEICSVPQVGNGASDRVARRLGMRFTGDVEIPASDGRGALRGHLYRLTRAEWHEEHRAGSAHDDARPEEHEQAPCAEDHEHRRDRRQHAAARVRRTEP